MLSHLCTSVLLVIVSFIVLQLFPSCESDFPQGSIKFKLRFNSSSGIGSKTSQLVKVNNNEDGGQAVYVDANSTKPNSIYSFFFFFIVKFVQLRLWLRFEARFNTDEKLMEEDGSLRFTGCCEEDLLPGGRPVQVGNNAWVFFVLFFYFTASKKINTRPEISFQGPAPRP